MYKEVVVYRFVYYFLVKKCYQLPCLHILVLCGLFGTRETCAVTLVIIINYDDEQYYELTCENDAPKPELKY